MKPNNGFPPPIDTLRFILWIDLDPAEFEKFWDWSRNDHECGGVVRGWALYEAVEWGLPSGYQHWNTQRWNDWARHCAHMSSTPFSTS